MAFLHDVYSLRTRLPRTAPEGTDPFLATVTPDGVPIEEPSSTRLGSSRKGGEGARIAAARKVMRSLRGQMAWEKEQEQQEMLASLPGSGSRPHPGRRQHSPRTNGVKLAPLPGASGMNMSPKPPGSAERVETPDDGMLEMNESMMPPLPGGPSEALTAADFSEQMVANSFASLGWPSLLPSEAVPPGEGAAADGLGESAPFDVQNPDAADPGEEEQPGAPDGASAAPGDLQMEEKPTELGSVMPAAGKNDEVDPAAGEGGEDPMAATAAMPAAEAAEVKPEPAEDAAEAGTDLADAVVSAPNGSVATADHPPSRVEAVASVAQVAAEVAPEPASVNLQPSAQFVRAKIHVTEEHEEVEAHIDEESEAGMEEDWDEEEEDLEEEEAVKVCFDFGRTSSYIDYIQRTQSANLSGLLKTERSTGFLFESTPVKVEISVSEPEKPVTLELLCRPDQGPAGDASHLPSVTAEMAVAEDSERPVTLALRCAEQPASGPQGAPVAAKLVVNEADRPVTLQLRCSEELDFTGSFVFPAPSAESSELMLESTNPEPKEPSTNKTTRFPPPPVDIEAPPVVVSLQVIATPKTSRTPKTARTPKAFATPKSTRSTTRKTRQRRVRLELVIDGVPSGNPAFGSTPTPAGVPTGVSAQVLPNKSLLPSSGKISLSLSITDDSDKPVTVTMKYPEAPESQGVASSAEAGGPVAMSLSITEGSENPVTVTLKGPEATRSQGMPVPEAAGPVALCLSIAEESETPVTVTLKVPETPGSQARALPEADGRVTLSLSVAEGSKKPVTAILKCPKTSTGQSVPAPEAAGPVALSLSIAEASDNPVTVTLTSPGATESRSCGCSGIFWSGGIEPLNCRGKRQPCDSQPDTVRHHTNQRSGCSGGCCWSGVIGPRNLQRAAKTP